MKQEIELRVLKSQGQATVVPLRISGDTESPEVLRFRHGDVEIEVQRADLLRALAALNVFANFDLPHGPYGGPLMGHLVGGR